MKGRLKSALWIVIGANILALGAVLWLAYNAGAKAGGVAITDAPSVGANGARLLIALIVGAGALVFMIVQIHNRVLEPVKRLTEFSERLSAGDYRTRASIDVADDFGFIAEHLNRAAESHSRAVFNQEAQENLQKSVTEFLTIVSQIARGDLTLRGRVSNDALGNVVDSVNYMLDNFAKVLERVRKAAIDVQSSANEILIASEEMSTGGRRRAGQPVRTRHAGRHAAHTLFRASHSQAHQGAGRSFAGNF